MAHPALVDYLQRRLETAGMAASTEKDRSRSLLDGFAQATWEADADGAMTADSPSWCAYTGQGTEERLGFGWLDAVHRDDRACAERQWREAVADGRPVDTEFRLHVAGDGWRWTNMRAVPALNDDGSVRKWVGLNIDVDARKGAETALRRSEDLRRIAISGGRMGTWRWDTREGVIEGDVTFCNLWGLPASSEAHSIAALLERMSPQGRARKRAVAVPGVEPGAEFDEQLQIVAGSTAGTWVRWRGRAEQDEPWIINGVSFDVTEQKRADERLRESEERFRQFAEASSNALWIRDAATLAMEYASPAVKMIYGVGAEALLGDLERWALLIVPDDRDVALAHLERAEAGEAVTHEFRIRRPSDGAVRWIRDTDFPLLDDRGRVQRIGGIAEDVTGLKAGEAALTQSEQRLRTLVEGVPQLVWRAVGEGDWTWASPQWADYTGQPEPASHRLGWLEPMHPDDHGRLMNAWHHAFETGGFEVECRIRRASDGAYRWFQIRATPLRDEAGETVEWIGTSTDVDDLRRLQESQAVMVAELQHRTRNLIAVVRAIADDTMEHTGPTEAFPVAFYDRLAALSRVQGLLSRSQTEPVTIGALVRLELDALGAFASSERVAVSGPPVHLRAFTVQTLALALHELATNARKHGALSHGHGHLAVTWRERDEGGERRLVLDWVETGLEHAADKPPPTAGRVGYGRELIERALPHAFGARTSYVLTASGVRCAIDMPVRPGQR